jgi:transglutaminase-like putative cysteine protease
VLDVEHRILFEYDGFIREGWMELRVEPRSLAHQTLRSFQLAVGPASPVSRYADWNGNAVHHFGVIDYHNRVEVVARSLVDVHPTKPTLSDLVEAPGRAEGAFLDFASFRGPVIRSNALVALERELGPPASASLGEQVAALGKLVRERFAYRTDVTHAHSTSDHILEQGGGVCQDFAHLALGLLRLRGVVCRYVSGYLHVERDDGVPSQSHAWVEVHSPSHGWVGFDPTHDCLPDDRYVIVGYGRDYDDVPPNRGIYRGSAAEQLKAEVHTRRVEAPPDVGSLHDQIVGIEVPVYRELPSAPRTGRSELPEQEPEAAQQQQQQ